MANLNRIYAVFAGTRWGMTRRKRDALRVARNEHAIVGYVVDDAAISAWDAPTFRAVMTPIADYRETE